MLNPPSTDCATVRVLIVSDKSLRVIGLKGALASFSQISIVGHTTTIEAAGRELEAMNADVLLVDLQRPDVLNASLFEAVHIGEQTGLVFLASAFEEKEILERLGRGIGLCSEDSSAETLACMLQCVKQGYSCFPKDLGSQLSKLLDVSVSTRHHNGFRPSLTEREVEILRLISQGLTNLQIAKVLTMSQATTKTHVRSIFAKLGVPDRTTAAVEGVRLGFIVA